MTRRVDDRTVIKGVYVGSYSRAAPSSVPPPSSCSGWAIASAALLTLGQPGGRRLRMPRAMPPRLWRANFPQGPGLRHK